MIMTKNFEYKIFDGNIGYFRFFDTATEEDYMNAFEDFMLMINDPFVDRFIVAVEVKSKWNNTIEGLWLKTAELAEQYNIKKWGIVTPDSAIRKLTLKRVVKKNKFESNLNYEFHLASNENEVFEWIK